VFEDAWQKKLGLLTHMYASLQRFLFPLAQQVVSILCSNYALEGILDIQSRKESERKERGELLRAMVKAIVPNTSSFFFSSYMAIPEPTFDHQCPPSTILFDFVSSRLKRLLSETEEQIIVAGDEPYVTLFSDLFSSKVTTDSIYPAIQIITNTPALFDSFKVDFFSRILHLFQMPKSWIDALSNMLAKFALDFGIRANSVILDYFLVYHLRREFVMNFCTFIRPLLQLHGPSELINNITRTELQIRTWDQLHSFLWDHIVRHMWSKILEIDQNELANWLAVFQHLHYLAPYHISLLGVLSQSRVIQWDLLSIWGFFLATFSYRIQLSTRKFIAKVSLLREHQGLQSLIPAISHFCDLLAGYVPM
jgi:hypothetical protein